MGINKDNRVGIGAPDFVSIGLPPRCETKGAPASIIVVDCVKWSC